jgi:hypothetical protein
MNLVAGNHQAGVYPQRLAGQSSVGFYVRLPIPDMKRRIQALAGSFADTTGASGKAMRHQAGIIQVRESVKLQFSFSD